MCILVFYHTFSSYYLIFVLHEYILIWGLIIFAHLLQEERASALSLVNKMVESLKFLPVQVDSSLGWWLWIDVHWFPYYLLSDSTRCPVGTHLWREWTNTILFNFPELCSFQGWLSWRFFFLILYLHFDWLIR